MGLFREIFVWWSGNSWGNRWMIWRHGRKVGEDELGNGYYEQRRGVGPLGTPRRWVVYSGLAEASKVPPGWHGWLHHTLDKPPAEQIAPDRDWQLPHRPNLTGTAQAYRPPGSILSTGKRAKAGGDYEPWRPE